ncbi:hypothetical protein BCR44DRAFT_83418 [Catenaria anguillulae PL171]|uniref:Uncharacterized protein n=1 Tax=Catenaria anguillulae PL171 TaxID=765915 RepID=A0A1Y2I3F8_9FUNG|nr:hypothetical protein BCR44DRAFT_83418 [Catenaria anguillulae PL171]
MFSSRQTPSGLPPLAHSTTGAVMMPAPPSMDLPPNALAKLFASCTPAESLPLDPSVPYFNPLLHDPAHCPLLPHEIKALDIASALAKRTLPLDTQKKMLDKTLCALADQRRAAAAAAATALFARPRSGAPRPFTAPQRAPMKHFARPTVPSLPAAPTRLSSSRPSPVFVPTPSARPGAAGPPRPAPTPRPITPPTTAGGRVIPGFTPLPDMFANDNSRTPERARSPKSPETVDRDRDGEEDHMDLVQDEVDDEIVIQVPDGGFGQSHLDIDYYDVSMVSLIGDDEDY